MNAPNGIKVSLRDDNKEVSDFRNGIPTYFRAETTTVAIPVVGLSDDKLEELRKCSLHRQIYLTFKLDQDKSIGKLRDDAISIGLPDYVDTRIISALTTRQEIKAIFEPRAASEAERIATDVALLYTGLSAVVSYSH